MPAEPSPSAPSESKGGSRALLVLAIGAVTAFVVAVVSLLVAVLLIGGDDAVFGALRIALAAGAVALPTAWLWLGRQSRARDAA